MSNILITTEQQIEQLEQQLFQLKEQQALSASPPDAEQAVLEGELQTPDTYQTLKTKRLRASIIEVVFRRIAAMVSIRPIIGNIIAIGLAMLALFYVYQEVDIAGFESYKSYFGIGIQLFGAIQIIKSGTRSLLLPLIAMVWGGMVAHSFGAHDALFTFGKAFYEHLMIVGIIGVGASVLTID